jgi:hypothetical protein
VTVIREAMAEQGKNKLQEEVKNNFASLTKRGRMERRSLHNPPSSSLPNRPRTSPSKRSVSPMSKFGGSARIDSDSMSTFSRSSRSVKETFVRAQTARQYYFPQSPRMSTSPHSAREMLLRIQSGRERLSRPSTAERNRLLARPLTTREKIKNIEDKIVGGSVDVGIKSMSRSFVSITSSRVHLPKIMPCQRSDDIILAQAKQRITRRLLAKESQMLGLDDIKAKVEQKYMRKQALRKATEDDIIKRKYQKFSLVAVHALVAMSILMNSTRTHRRDSMALLGTPAKVKFAGSSKKTYKKSRSFSPKARAVASAFITNPDGTELIVGEDDHNGECDSSSIVLYEQMTSAYQLFLQIIVSRKWRLVMALSILRKRAAARIIRTSIPFMIKGPKVCNMPQCTLLCYHTYNTNTLPPFEYI